MKGIIYEKPDIEPMNNNGEAQPMCLILIIVAAAIFVNVAAILQGVGVVEVAVAGGSAYHAVNVANTINYYS